MTENPKCPGMSVAVAKSLNLYIPRDLTTGLVELPDAARNMGLVFTAPPGAGKSRALGRLVAFTDFLRGVPLIVFDPTGGTIDNFLHKIVRLPRDLQERLWPRVLYVNCAGSGEYVVPMPLYYRLGEESLYTVSQRLPDVWRRLDPNLQRASILGWNSLHPLATATGIIIAALGYQVTEAADLVRNPEAWAGRIAAAVERYPEAASAARYFAEEFMRLAPRERSERAQALLVKLGMFTWEPATRVMYGASTPGIQWEEVVEGCLAVLCDFREIPDAERLRFSMLWLFRWVVDFIRWRGPGHHQVPVSWIIDELTALMSPANVEEHLLANDLEELVSRLARSHMVWLTLCLQSLDQVPERIQRLLLRMGTQIFGSTTDPATARFLASRFHRYAPHRLKKREPMYATAHGESWVIDHRTVELSIDEQRELNSVPFMELPRYHFLVAASPEEGTVPTTLRRMSIGRFDAGDFVDEELVQQARELLMRRRGQKVSELLAQIDARLALSRTITTQRVVTVDQGRYPRRR